jgi:hypothetical protein
MAQGSLQSWRRTLCSWRAPVGLASAWQQFTLRLAAHQLADLVTARNLPDRTFVNRHGNARFPESDHQFGIRRLEQS